MLRALAALLCAILGLSAAQAQYRPGYAPNFRSGFQFVNGLPLATYDFAGGTFPAVSVSRVSSGDLAADASGAYTAFAANTLRRTNVGATIEGAQTNAIRNSSMQGAVAGTPGTAPNFWSITTPAGLTRTIALQSRNNLSGILLSYSGTTTASAGIIITFEGTTQVAAASGQSWTASAFLQVDTPQAGVTWGLDCLERDGAGASLTLSNVAQSGNGFQRVITPRTFSNASAAFALSRAISTTIPSGTAVNVAIWVGLPQLERMDTYVVPGRVVTTPIATLTAAVTRAADSTSFTVPAGASKILYTFDDGSQQQVSVSPGVYTVPTNLARPVIARAQVLP